MAASSLTSLRAVQQFDEGDGEHAGERGAENEQRGVDVLDDEEGDDDAQEDGVADGVAHHGHLAQDEEDAGQRAGDGDDDGDELDF